MAARCGKDPFVLSSETLGKSRVGIETERLLSEADIRAGVAHVTRFSRLQLRTHRQPGRHLQRLHGAAQGDPRPTAQVHDHPLRCVHGSDQAAHDVVDVCEVAGLLAVAEDDDVFTVQTGADESMEGHVGPLTRSKHREEAKGDGRYVVVAQVEGAEMLPREFGHAIG